MCGPCQHNETFLSQTLNPKKREEGNSQTNWPSSIPNPPNSVEIYLSVRNPPYPPKPEASNQENQLPGCGQLEEANQSVKKQHPFQSKDSLACTWTDQLKHRGKLEAAGSKLEEAGVEVNRKQQMDYAAGK
ncbi:Hypothetical predicted protein [Olea europaea subsp. europaea]|uniref:Uncharacterized protein n=1 Tax=Olea europaea subsp. europaea TaxID=158383 RepID=A0A8S0R6H1_OLEEU|nr:Hypothetical predicted protein [Olea europaea subsp. europaea]